MRAVTPSPKIAQAPPVAPADLDRLADEVVAAARVPFPVDAYELCLWADCEVRMGRVGVRPCVLGRTIIIAPEDPPERQRFAATHELSHLLLRERGLPDDEWSVNWLASALLHPRAWFDTLLDRLGWDLVALRRECSYSSHEAIGRRIVNLRRAVLWVCDRGAGKRTSRRTRSTDTDPCLARPTSIERDAISTAARSLEPVRIGPVAAWPLPHEGRDWLRVVSIANADDLAATLRGR